MLLAIALINLPNVSRGQCPDASFPDPGPPWNPEPSQHILLPNTNCWVTVTLCGRNNDGDYEVSITSITPDPGDTCEDPFVLFEGALEYYESGVSFEDLSIPPCGQGPVTVHVYLLRCWSVSIDSHTLIPTWTACPDGNLSCTATYSECYDVGTGKDVVTNVTVTPSGTYDGKCSALPSPLPPWYLFPQGPCYDFGNLCGPN